MQRIGPDHQLHQDRFDREQGDGGSVDVAPEAGELQSEGEKSGRHDYDAGEHQFEPEQPCRLENRQEFKREALRLWKSSGRPAAAVASADDIAATRDIRYVLRKGKIVRAP